MAEKPDRHDPNAQDNTKQWKRCCFNKFTMSYYYGNDIAKMLGLGCDGEIYDMLRIRLHEAGSDEEMFTSRLGLYQVTELDEEGFNVYFEGCLRSDEHFNAHDYWLSISREEHLGLSQSHTCTIRNLILRVVYKMITYGLYQRTTGYDMIHKNDLWLQNTTTLKDLIDYNGKLIPEDPRSGVPRVSILRPPRASMQDLYDRMGRMEIFQEAIEHMEYRQSYHWDMYHGVFEHMAGFYSVPLQGAYNPPGYAQPQYDQYY
nr:hypothetical protein [Tanacetum cinerariifolium]